MRWVVPVCFLCLVIAIGAPALAKPHIDPAIHDISGENIPIIIRYRDGYSADAMRATLTEFQKRREHSSMNAVSGYATQQAIEALENNPAIESIEYDAPVHAALQDVLPLINATKAQQSKSGSGFVDGTGETICIIDSGIDYTHPALGGCAATANINGGSCAKVIGGHNYCANENCTAENDNPLDNNGHGTHVAGIAAANGAIKGVAPNARMVAVKTLNSEGEGSLSDVEAAIRWCTEHAGQLGISVISMSLSTDTLHSGQCDSLYPSLAGAINNATAHGISVVAATGNGGNTSSIGSPACIKNATAVASSTKGDTISIFSNRNALVSVVAPGSLINSTAPGGGYTIKSGTSMATPAAAGAFALLRQYEKQESGAMLQPPEIRSILANTGAKIFDPGTGRNYSRINLLPALVLLDDTPPKVTSDLQNAIFAARLINLTFTATDNIAMDRCWYKNSTLTVELPNCANTTITAGEGQNALTIFANDTKGNQANAPASFTVDTLAPQLLMQLPSNMTFTKWNMSLNFTAKDATPVKCFYSIDDGPDGEIQQCRNTTFAVPKGHHKITLKAADAAGNTNSTSTFFTVAGSDPFITIHSPRNQVYAGKPPLNYAVIHDIPVSCSYKIGSATTQLPGCANVSAIGSEGENKLTLTATDSVNNSASQEVTFTIDTIAPRLELQKPKGLQNTSTVLINFTLFDANADKCWYETASGNASLPVCQNTTIEMPEGSHTLTIFANDTVGNANSTSTQFAIDTTPPDIAAFSGPSNETLDRNNLTISITSSEKLSSAKLFFNGTARNMSSVLDETVWKADVKNLNNGNYTFFLQLTDKAGNVFVSGAEWVVIDLAVNITASNSTIGISHFLAAQESALESGTEFSIFKDGHALIGNIVERDGNYTLAFAAEGIAVEVYNFSWQGANLSRTIGVTGNIPLNSAENASAAAGGALDKALWVDMNNFAQSYKARAIFSSGHIFFYLNESKSSPVPNRITKECNEAFSELPCLDGLILYLNSFSGVAVANDTEAPKIQLFSPTAAQSQTNSMQLQFSVTDNIAVGSCWHVLNGVRYDNPLCVNTSIEASGGQNTLLLGANDTTGNAATAEVNFSVQSPSSSAQSAPSSSGGGSGGGGASFKPDEFAFAGNGTIRLATKRSGTAVESVEIHASEFMRAALRIRQSSENAPFPYYQIIELTPLDFSEGFEYAKITFAVPKQWLAENNAAPASIVLYRQANGEWTALGAEITSNDPTSVTYSASTTGFSLFAIAPVQEQAAEQQPQKVCTQVITPATDGANCVEYATPCDVPEGWTVIESCPEAEETPLPSITGLAAAGQNNAIIVLAVVAAIALAAAAKRAAKKPVRARVKPAKAKHTRHSKPIKRATAQIARKVKKAGPVARKTARKSPAKRRR